MKTVSRRNFLKAAALAAGTVGLAACATSTPAPTQAPAAPTEAPKPAEPTAAPAPAEPTKAPEPAAPASKFKEAPMLAEMVKAGKLPPVDERLPENPQVVTPLVTRGQYGGTLRQGIVGTSVTWGGGLYTFQWEGLVQWKPDFADVEPSLAERIEISPDATEYTFYLRKGIKWSDGAPFTADDIMFYVNDVMFNKELSPSGPGPADWLPGDQREGFRAEKVDDHTFKLIFAKPYGTLLYQLATWGGRFFTYYPKHYLQQFHAAYNEKIDDLVKAEGKENWMQLFFAKGPDTWGNPDRFMDVPEYPSLGPWVVTQPLGAGTTARFTRNPYYWKVDDQGNQLPYMDEVVITSYQDPEVLTLAMLNGDLDYIQTAGDKDRELYFDAVDQGKPLKIVSRKSDGGNTMSIHFNMGSKNPMLREIFQNKDFRIGMSHAINREELIEVVFKGQGKPAQVAPLEDSPLYNERLANQYLEYDVAKANEHLDKVLPNKDANGMRLGPDGKPLTLIWTLLDQNYGGGDARSWLQAAELCLKYFKAVGVDVKMDVVADPVLLQRRDTNDIDMFAFHGGEGGAGITAIIDPRWHIPGEYWGMFSWGWAPYLNDAEITDAIKQNFVEPPPGMKEIREMWVKATQQPTYEGQVAEMRKLMEVSADMFWCIGISRYGLGYLPMNKRLVGVPDGAFGGWLTGTHKITRPEQWWLEG